MSRRDALGSGCKEWPKGLATTLKDPAVIPERAAFALGSLSARTGCAIWLAWAPDIAVRWVPDRDRKAIVRLDLREVEDGPWVLGTVAEEKDLERKRLRDHPGLIDREECPGVDMGDTFPAWVHTVHNLRDDGRREFVRSIGPVALRGRGRRRTSLRPRR